MRPTLCISTGIFVPLGKIVSPKLACVGVPSTRLRVYADSHVEDKTPPFSSNIHARSRQGVEPPDRRTEGLPWELQHAAESRVGRDRRREGVLQSITASRAAELSGRARTYPQRAGPMNQDASG